MNLLKTDQFEYLDFGIATSHGSDKNGLKLKLSGSLHVVVKWLLGGRLVSYSVVRSFRFESFVVVLVSGLQYDVILVLFTFVIGFKSAVYFVCFYAFIFGNKLIYLQVQMSIIKEDPLTTN